MNRLLASLLLALALSVPALAAQDGYTYKQGYGPGSTLVLNAKERGFGPHPQTFDIEGAQTIIFGYDESQGDRIVNPKGFAVSFRPPASASLKPTIVMTPPVEQVPPSVPQPVTLSGINLSGGEFSEGALWQPPSEIDWYADRGFKLFRIPFHLKWYADAPIDALYARAEARGVTLVLDAHDFSATIPVSFWVEKGKRYPNAWLDLQNEPAGKVFETWAAHVQDSVTALRAAGVTNKLVIEGLGSSAVWRWSKGDQTPAIDNGTAFMRLNGGKGLYDPLSNFLFSPHFYTNPGGSGTSSECRDGADVFEPQTKWAREHGFEYLLGEFAFGNWKGMPGACADKGRSIIAHMKANPDVWVGYTVYGGGLAWNPTYIFAVDPKALDHTKGPDADSDYLKAIR